MIKYNNKTINDWNFDNDNIIKVYRNNAVCYYKIEESSTAQTPCYAVVDDITQYHETEFVDVYDKATSKWYKLNNLGVYEEYGIYGEGLNITYYDGKLTKYDGNEYESSGGTWVNVGEISGSSVTIKSPEYIEKNTTYNGKINIGVVLKDNTKFQFKFRPSNAGGGAILGEYGSPGDNDDYRFFWASGSLYYDYGDTRLNKSLTFNAIYEFEIGNYYIKNMATSATVLTGTTKSGVATSHTRNIWLGLGDNDFWLTYYLKVYEGETLIRDFIPWTDMNGNYGLYDKVSMGVFSATTGDFTASTVINDVTISGGETLPVEYEEIDAPPAELSFNTMEEALAYECPYVGVIATIGGVLYFFNSDYEWERLTFTITGITTSSSDFTILLNGVPTTATVYSNNGDGTYDWGIVALSAVTTTSGMCSGNTNIKKFDFYSADTSNLTSVGNRAFYNCSGLTSVNIPSGVTSIGSNAFYNCRSLPSIILPDSVTSIGNNAFMYCSGLTSVDIGSGVTRIGTQAFLGCGSLTNVTIPNGVPIINKQTFQYCSGLTSIDIPDSVTSITDGAFEKCYGLTSVDIPDSVITIGQYPFRNCSGLTSVTIGSGVTTIGNYAFMSCQSLTGITVYATTPPTLGGQGGWFDNTNNCPIYVPCESETAYKTAPGWSDYESRIQCFNPTPTGAVASVQNSYSATTSPTKIANICGSDVLSIGIAATPRSITISGCATTVNSALTTGNITFFAKATTVVADNEYAGTDLYDGSVSSEITSIGNGAFANNTKMVNFHIGNYSHLDPTSQYPTSNIQSIGNYAFSGCTALKNIEIEHSDIVPTLGTDAFDGCPLEAIWVKPTMVNAFKAASGWSDYANIIQAL